MINQESGTVPHAKRSVRAIEIVLQSGVKLYTDPNGETLIHLPNNKTGVSLWSMSARGWIAAEFYESEHETLSNHDLEKIGYVLCGLASQNITQACSPNLALWEKVEEDAVTFAVYQLMRTHHRYQAGFTEFHGKLELMLRQQKKVKGWRFAKGLPKTPAALSARLGKSESLLGEIGIRVNRGRTAKGGEVTLERLPMFDGNDDPNELSSAQPSSTNSSQLNGLHQNGDVDDNLEKVIATINNKRNHYDSANLE